MKKLIVGGVVIMVWVMVSMMRPPRYAAAREAYSRRSPASWI
jgi:uncharacterized BrkB/YihY/UPF0761 family membrane protein